MSEQPFEDVPDVTEESDTVGPTFGQVEDKIKEDRQDNWSSEEIPVPEVDEDEEAPA